MRIKDAITLERIKLLHPKLRDELEKDYNTEFSNCLEDGDNMEVSLYLF